MRMSLKSRNEYLSLLSERYLSSGDRATKSRIIDELVQNVGYHRKYAIRVLCHPAPRVKPAKRKRRRRYLEALPVIQVVWEALGYCCAERLHPSLLPTAKLLAEHGELRLTPEVAAQLASISRATLARRLEEMPPSKARRRLSNTPSPGLRSEVPLGRYPWDERRPGAIEIDLVEHNGGSSTGHYAYTLDVVDVVTGWSRRRAVLGRGQAGVFAAIQGLIDEWPYAIWALHSDNGSEFISKNLIRFCKDQGLQFTRSRPYKKNDSAHIEQRNGQFVRGYIGYERHETPEEVAWLNQVFAQLDVYANLFLPTRKLIGKERRGSHIHKTYDTARTPFQRALDLSVLSPEATSALTEQLHRLNPLALSRHIEQLLTQGPEPTAVKPAAN